MKDFLYKFFREKTYTAMGTLGLLAWCMNPFIHNLWLRLILTTVIVIAILNALLNDRPKDGLA